MFNGVIGYLSNERDRFNENVKDNFGNSIDLDMFYPIYQDLLKLQETYQNFKVTGNIKAQSLTVEKTTSIGNNDPLITTVTINSLTIELRTIIWE